MSLWLRYSSISSTTTFRLSPAPSRYQPLDTFSLSPSITLSIPGFYPLLHARDTDGTVYEPLSIPDEWQKVLQSLQPILPNVSKKRRSTQSTSSTISTTVTSDKSANGMIILICGPRNVGKSTFSRLVINTLLNKHKRIAYLETDVGQCEFTPSGLVSLHVIDAPIFGPPHTHLRQPEW